ncbi:ABC transporter permease [Herbaspirillum autotrophicum]|uniref:ABC transporter permease n=1 Tax=Herbaspirillum autotrophicum TaxID=180195 RepID=UPI00067C415C|nr:ABC transporter permease [Herbaspirillum autotrophicum]
MQLVPYVNPSRWRMTLAPVWALSGTLLISALLIWLAHAPVLQAFGLLLSGGFGSMFAWSETLTRATPLILTGLAAAIAFRARLYNIGAEGQLYMGALAAIVVGGMHGGTGWGLPVMVEFPLMLLAAALAGALLLLIPTVLKTHFGVDEVVTTLLLNFIALLFVSMMLDGPMKDPLSMGWPQSVALNPELELTRLVDKLRIHSGLVMAVVLALLIHFVNKRTVFGFEMRAVGANARASRFAGMSVNSVMIKTALLSGAVAGLAGAFEVAGRTSYITLDMSPGYGYTGIVIAMLAALNPVGVVFASIFIAGILVGADSMSRSIGVPTYLADVVVAVSLISMLIAVMLAKYKIILK